MEFTDVNTTQSLSFEELVIPIIDDSTVEPCEYFICTLQAQDSVRIIEPNQVTIRICDDGEHMHRCVTIHDSILWKGNDYFININFAFSFQRWLFVGLKMYTRLLKVNQQLYSLLQTQYLYQPQSAFKDLPVKFSYHIPTAFHLSLCVDQPFKVEKNDCIKFCNLV